MHIRHGFGSVHHVKVYDQEHFLGFLSLTVEEPKPHENFDWVGQIRGSDYLVWGLNYKKVRFEFSQGASVYVVVRSGGRAVPVNQ